MRKYLKRFWGSTSAVERIAVGANLVLAFLFFTKGISFEFVLYVQVWGIVFLIFCFSFLFRLFYAVWHKKNKTSLRNIFYFGFRSSFVYYVVFLFHFNIKANVYLLNNTYHDDLLLATEKWFAYYIDGIFVFRDWLTGLVGPWINEVYLGGFLAMFMVSFVFFHLYRDRKKTRAMLDATFLTSIIGSVGYALMPALGPFAFSGELYPHQLGGWQHLVETGEITRAYAVFSLAAMPSLHVAHGIIFTYMAAKYFRRLLWFMVPMMLLILTDAVYLEWHYVIDMVVGACIAWFAVWFIERERK